MKVIQLRSADWARSSYPLIMEESCDICRALAAQDKVYPLNDALSMQTEYSEDDCCFWPETDSAITTFMGEEVYFERGVYWVTLPKAKVSELINSDAEQYKELRREDRLIPILDKITPAQMDALIRHILTEDEL